MKTGGLFCENYEINDDAYNWWATKEYGVFPIIALVQLADACKVKGFDVRFDSGAFEQGWAIQQGLAERPRRKATI